MVLTWKMVYWLTGLGLLPAVGHPKAVSGQQEYLNQTEKIMVYMTIFIGDAHCQMNFNIRQVIL